MDNLINVEEAVLSLNYLYNDTNKAYCVRGGLDICELDLETDTYKMISSILNTDDQIFINTFENKDGEVFYSRTHMDRYDKIDICNMNGLDICQIHSDGGSITKGVSLYNDVIIGINRDQNNIYVYKEDGVISRHDESQTVHDMMRDMIDDDDDVQGKTFKSRIIKK